MDHAEQDADRQYRRKPFSDEYTIKIQLKFLLGLGGALIAAVIFVWTLRLDVINLLVVVAKQQTLLEQNQQAIMQMQSANMLQVEQFRAFREQYERDMKRYVRE